MTANPRRLPLGFAVTTSASLGTTSGSRLLVVGFLDRRQSVELRLLDGDGSILAASRGDSRSPAAEPSSGLPWSFEAVLDIGQATPVGGRDTPLLAVAWGADRARVTCLVPLAWRVGGNGPMPLLPLDRYARCT